MGTRCLSDLWGGSHGLRLNWQQTKGFRMPQMLLVTDMFGVSTCHGLPIPRGDPAVQYQTGGDTGSHTPGPFRPPLKGVSALFCQLWDLGGEGGGISSILIGSTSHGGWLLAVACCHTGPTLPEGCPHTAANNLVTGAQSEGKPSWPVPTVCPTTVKTYCFLCLITHVALSSGRMES